MTAQRKCERRTEDGAWVEVSMIDIKSGDVFRMFDPDGSPSLYQGVAEMTAKDDAELIFIEDQEVPCVNLVDTDD